jgi:DNA-binding PadR family transcriptional regulator
MCGPGRPITDQILAYLIEHPEAQDSLEGITEWWLLEQQIRYGLTAVDGALNNLVADDLLVTRQCADGRIYYGLNRAKEREIRRHLREAESVREPETDAGSREPSEDHE